MRSTYSKRTVFLFWSIFLVLFLTMDLALGHFEVRPMKKLYMKIRTPHPYYHHDLKPNQISYFEEVGSGYGYPLTTNSLGFKDASTRQVPLQADKKRILFIGDSFTEGLFFPYEETFTGQIARQRPDLDILNAGVSSYSPLIYYLKVDYLLNKVGLKFDELFVFIDISDIQDEYLYLDVERFTPLPETNDLKNFLFKADRFVFNHSYGYNFLKQAIEKMSEKVRIVDARGKWTLNQHFYDTYRLNIKEENVKKWADKGIAHAEENMQKLVNLCKARNIALTIVVYPWDAQIYARDLPSKQELIWRAFARKNGIGFMDLFPVFINNESAEAIFSKYFLPGDLHWNASGHALVAREVLAYLEKRNNH